MSLASFSFLAFCIVTLIVFYLIPQRFQWIWLLFMNIIFYVNAGAGTVVFILATSVISWLGCMGLSRLRSREMVWLKNNKQLPREEKQREKSESEKRRKRVLACVLVFILGQLICLKYGNFLLQNINGIFHTDFLLLGILMPLGISFYTIFCIGYCIDVYRGQYEAQTNLLKHITVITFFPCITQGPIERYDHLSVQIFAEHKISWNEIRFGTWLMLWGFFKKLVIADSLAVATNLVFYDSQGKYRGFYIFLAAILYAVQLYADFSGYTDIVRGFSQCLGIYLAENFDSPYLSGNVAEFWRRWHMSLGTWFKDYVFYSVLRSRWCQSFDKWSRKRFSRRVSSNLTTTAGLLINWTLIGLWHGSSWKFAAYGLYYGLIMIVSIWLKPVYEKLLCIFHIQAESFLWRLFEGIRTFLIVSFGYILFCANGVMHFLSLVKNMVCYPNPWIFVNGGIFSMGINRRSALALAVFVLILLFVDILHSKGHRLRAEIAQSNLIFRWLLLYGVIFAILIFGAYGPEYSASDFIYQNF